MERKPDKPGPIRPQGTSSRLPFLLFVALVAALFIGYRYVTDSEMYRTAETFVRQNEEIRTTFGEVRHCRLWFPFKVDFPDDAPRIHLTLQVEGAKADTVAYVTLTREGTKWRVVAASYEDGRGQIRPLLKVEKSPAAKGKAGQTAAPQTKPKAKSSPEGEELKKGHRAYREKNFDQAIAAYDRAILLAPDSFVAFYWRGRAFAEKGLDDKALADMQKTIQLRLDHIGAWRWLGYLQGKNNRFDDCVASLTKAIDLQADHAWTYYNRGRCYFKKGDSAKALEDAKKSCSLGLKEGCRIAEQIKARK
jgi:Flp pilus assembly protein TadD